MTLLDNAKGVSIIAAIFIIVVLAFMGVMFLTMVNTGSLTAVNDLQSTQALSIAEGGVEFEQLILGQNVDWYRSLDPFAMTTQNLGSGSFKASINIPATELRSRLTSTATVMTVYSTSRFPSSGYLQVGDDITTAAEYVHYAGIAGNTFTGLARAQTIGSINSIASNTFDRGDNVYPVAQLVTILPATCLTPTSITAKVEDSSNIKFLSAGTLDIKGEEIQYSGLTVAGLNITFTGIQRCCPGVGCPSVATVANDPVTPVLVGGVTADNQAEITSQGTVVAAARTVKKTVRRGP